ncbi:MAG TPA: TonB-dependent receptor plug domain-containing protein, partial [Paludibacter sp.]|nr:TonB-dependent receptor plug domain-containing protein [Paludibacter sp.]
MNAKLFISLILALIAIPLSFGQTQTDTVHVNLSGIDVVAERNKIFSDMGRIVTVLSKKDIQKLSVNSIDELLESIPGIDIRNRGINGTQADISMRGGSFDQVLVLLNGVNITDPQTGHYNLDIPLDLADVMRVEVLQGSSARIYGPNAFSGAINIVTEKNIKKELTGQLTGGSYNSFGQSLTAALGSEKIQSFISLSHKSSEGYRENTDFRMYNAFSQTIIRTENAGKFDFQASYQQKAYGANGFYSLAYPNQFDFTRTIFSALNWSLSKG